MHGLVKEQERLLVVMLAARSTRRARMAGSTTIVCFNFCVYIPTNLKNRQKILSVARCHDRQPVVKFYECH